MRPVVDARLSEALAGVNFAHGRGGCPYPVDMLVIHVTEGNAASVRSWFRNPAAQVSAHYLVRTDGGVEQFVDEEDKAFHAGQLVSPTAALVVSRFANGRWTPNSYAIGIEHEGDGTRELTTEQRDATYALQLDIIARRKIPVDRTHIVGHHEIKASKTCPGAVSVDRIVADLTTLAPKPADYPRVVYSPALGDYLVVVRYVSDAEWYYIPASTLPRFVDGNRAGTALSQMPLRPA